MSAGKIKAGHAWVAIEAVDNTARVLRAASARMHAFAGRMSSLSTRMIGAGSLAAAPIALATKVFSSFDDQMRKVRAVSSASESQFAALTAQAKELGRTTSFTAAQVAELQTELGKAGFSPEEIQQQTPAILDLSRATDTDTSASAGIAAAALRQFALDASETQRVADGLTATANGTFNTLESIGEALKYAGPVAQQFNLSFEETLALVGALGNIGIQGSMAGTTLRNLQLRAASLPQEFRRLGVETMDAAGNLRSLLDILSDVDIATKHMGSGERAEALNRLMGVRSITGGASLSGNGAGIQELLDKIRGATGQSRRTSQEMDAGLGGTFRSLESAIEGIVIAVGSGIAPLATLIGAFNGLVPIATIWIEQNSHLVSLALAGAAGVAAMGGSLLGAALTMKTAALAILPLATALGLVKTVAVTLPALLLTVANPVGLLAAAVVGLIGVMAHAAGGWGEAWQAMSGTFTTAWKGILDKLSSGDLAGAGQVAMAGLRATWAETTAGMADMWIRFRGIVAGAWASLLNEINAIAGSVTTSIADQMLAFAGQDNPLSDLFRRTVLGMDAAQSQAFVGQGDAAREENQDIQRRRRRDGDAATQAWLDAINEDVERERAAARASTDEARQALAEALNEPVEERLTAEAQDRSAAPTTSDAAAAAAALRRSAAEPAAGLRQAISTALPDTLEKGSVEAARRAYENRQQGLMSELLTAAKQGNKEAENMADLMERLVLSVEGV